jgi:cytochrome c553
MRNMIGAAVWAATMLAATHVEADKPWHPPVPAKVTTTCILCHGLNGDSPASDVPRLNGQQAAYIKVRLKSFVYPGSHDPHATAAMWGVVSAIDDATLASLADYYARQEPTPISAVGNIATDGKKLYENGVTRKHIPACQTCHGADASGHDTIPRLAGQHAAYLRTQIERFRENQRASEPMHSNAAHLSEAQISALVAYLGRN